MAPWPQRLICLFGATWTACATTLPQPEFERFDLRITPSASDYPDAPAVILLDRGTLSMTVDVSSGRPIGQLRRYRRIKILREGGLSWTNLEIPYDPQTAIYGLRIQATLPNGEDFEVDRDQIADRPHRSLRRAKVARLPTVPLGTVIEYTYDVYIQDLRFIAPWTFQSTIPTVRSELAVIVPRGFSIDLRFSEFGRFVDRPPERFETERGTRFSWSQANLPAVFPENDMPATALLAPRAHIIFMGAKVGNKQYAGFASWDDVAQWFLSTVPNYETLSATTLAEAERITADASQEERALKLMEVLARDLKDTDGPPPPLWRADIPHPDAVLRQKRAHPTSRGLLLVALLKSIGLPAVPGLYVYRDQDILMPDAPTARSLTGVAAVLRKPSGITVLDPSQLTTSIDVPAPRLQDTRIIVLDPKGAEIRRVPISRPEASVTNIRFDLKMDARGDVYGPLKATLTGAEAGVLRARLLGRSPEQYSEIVTKFLKARGVAFTIESVNIADLPVLRRPLIVNGTVSKQSLFPQNATESPLPVGAWVKSDLPEPREVRRTPVVLGAPRTIKLRATVLLPSDHEYEELPPTTTLEWAGGQYTLQVRKETRRRFGILRTETYTALEVAPKAHRHYRRYRQDMALAEEQTVLIRRPPPRELEY